MPSAGAPLEATPSPARSVPAPSKTATCATPLLVMPSTPRVLPCESTSRNFCAVSILGAEAAPMAEAANIWPDTAPPTKAAAIVMVTNPIRSLMVIGRGLLIQCRRLSIPAEISRLDGELSKQVRGRERGKRIRKPKPHAGFGLPVCLHKNKD